MPRIFRDSTLSLIAEAAGYLHPYGQSDIQSQVSNLSTAEAVEVAEIAQVCLTLIKMRLGVVDDAGSP